MINNSKEFVIYSNSICLLLDNIDAEIVNCDFKTLVFNFNNEAYFVSLLEDFLMVPADHFKQAYKRVISNE